jgi:hypothetical protein
VKISSESIRALRLAVPAERCAVWFGLVGDRPMHYAVPSLHSSLRIALWSTEIQWRAFAERSALTAARSCHCAASPRHARA